MSATAALQFDTSGTLGVHTAQIGEFYFKGTGELSTEESANYSGIRSLLNKADLTQSVIAFTGENMTTSNTANSFISVLWNEIKD